MKDLLKNKLSSTLNKHLINNFPTWLCEQWENPHEEEASLLMLRCYGNHIEMKVEGGCSNGRTLSVCIDLTHTGTVRHALLVSTHTPTTHTHTHEQSIRQSTYCGLFFASYNISIVNPTDDAQLQITGNVTVMQTCWQFCIVQICTHNEKISRYNAACAWPSFSEMHRRVGFASSICLLSSGSSVPQCTLNAEGAAAATAAVKPPLTIYSGRDCVAWWN